MVLRYQYRVAWLSPYDLSLDLLFLVFVAGVLIARAIERRGPAGAGRIVLRAAVVGVVLVLAIVASEYGARFVFRNVRSSGNTGDFIGRRGGGPPIAVNSLGFRDREVPPKGDRFRIAVVGDSFTWGQGIEAGERFSNLLEGFLGPKYEVFNFGIPGDNLPEHLMVLERALPTSPDFVLLQLYINDFETPRMERPSSYPLLPGSMNDQLIASSLLYDLLSNQWNQLQAALGISETYPEYMAAHLRNPASPDSQEAFGMLRQFIENCRKAHVGVGIVLFPAPDAMGPHGANYPFGYLHDRVRQVCTDERAPYLDLLPAFSSYANPRSMWVTPFDAHPNAMANKRAAYEMLAAFSGLWRR